MNINKKEESYPIPLKKHREFPLNICCYRLFLLILVLFFPSSPPPPAPSVSLSLSRYPYLIGPSCCWNYYAVSKMDSCREQLQWLPQIIELAVIDTNMANDVLMDRLFIACPRCKSYFFEILRHSFGIEFGFGLLHQICSTILWSFSRDALESNSSLDTVYQSCWNNW